MTDLAVRRLGLVLLALALASAVAACGGEGGSNNGGTIDAGSDAQADGSPDVNGADRGHDSDVTDIPVDPDAPSSMSFVVGPDGGSFSTDGGVSLDVPAGALDESVTITVTPASLPDGVDLFPISPVWAFGPAGLEFDLPVTVIIAFDGGAGFDLSAYWTERGDETLFQPVEVALVDTDTATFEIDHFSLGFVGHACGNGEVDGLEQCDDDGDGCSDMCVCMDEREDDDDRDGASTIALPGAELRDLTVSFDDADWFEIALCDGGLFFGGVTATASFDGEAGNLDLFLYDPTSSSDTPLMSAEATEGDAELIAANGPFGSATSLLLEVREASDAVCVSYELDVASDCLCPDVTHEPDDIEAEATDLGLIPEATDVLDGAEMFSFDPDVDDFDWYRFTICPGEAVEVVLDVPGATSLLDDDLFDEAGALVGFKMVSADQVLIDYTNSDERAQQDLSLRVEALDINVCNAYGLVVRSIERPDDAVDEASAAGDDTVGAAESVVLGVGDSERFERLALDSDWYRFECDGGRFVVTTIEHEDDDGRHRVAMYDETGAQLLDAETVNVSSGRVEHADRDKEVVTVQVEPLDGTCLGYDIDLSCRCADDGAEDDDTSASARSISLTSGSATVSGTLSDEDWLLATECDSASYRVAASVDGEGDFSVAIYDRVTLLLLDSDTALSGSPAEIEYAGESDATELFVQLTPPESACIDYEVTLDCACGSRLGDDSLEPSDSIGEAQPIALDALIECLSVQDDDPDFYSFEMCRGGEITVATLFSHSEADINVVLRDSGGNVLHLEQSDTDNEIFLYDDDVEPERVGDLEPLVVEVFAPVVGDAATYDLLVGNRRCVTADAFEDNDTSETAAPLPLLGTPISDLTVQDDDEDWYSFPVCAEGQVSVQATFSHSDGNLDLRLRNPMGSIVASSLSLDDDESIDYADVRTPGTPDEAFFLQVTTGGGMAPETAYTLLVDTVCPCLDDAYEDNDSGPGSVPFGDPFTAPDSGSITGTTVGDDDDWFQIQTCANGTTTYSLDYDSDVYGLSLSLHSPVFGDPLLQTCLDLAGELMPCESNQLDGSEELVLDMQGTPRLWRLAVETDGSVPDDACVPYALSYQNDNCACLDLSDPLDDSLLGTPTPATFGTTFTSLRAGSESGADWFEVTDELCCGQTINVTVVTDTGVAPDSVDLLDLDGVSDCIDAAGEPDTCTAYPGPNIVGHDDTILGGEEGYVMAFQRTVLSDPSRFYIRVADSPGSCGAYSLSVFNTGVCSETCLP